MTTRLLIATNNPGKMREYSGLLREAPFELVSLADVGISHEVDETGLTFHENARLKASEYASLAGMLTLADDSGLEVDALGGQPGVRSARYGGDACRSDEDRVELLLKNLEGVPWEKRTARFRCVIAIVEPDDDERGEIPPAPLYESGVTRPFPNRALEPPIVGSEEAGESSSLQSGATRPILDRAPQPPIVGSEEAAESPPLQRGVRGDFRLASGRTTGNNDAARGPVLVAALVGSVSGMIQYAPEGNDGFGYDPVFFLPSFGKTIAQLSLHDKNQISHRADAAAKAVRTLIADRYDNN